MEGILSSLWPLFVVVIVLGLAVAVLKPRATISSVAELGYRKKKTLFTEAERSFLGVLDQCIDPAQYRVFGKVRVADIVEPNLTRNRSEWQKAFNAISAKHFDYVICSTDTLQPLCVIELDDKSHSQKKRQKRDQLLESICFGVELPLIRVPAKRSYKLDEVKKMLSQARFATSSGVALAAARTATPTGGENVTSQLLAKDKKTELSESDGLKLDEVQVAEIGGSVR
ncbi:MAG: DUF2726 domain-containing protein [Neptuniibacter sp.]